MRPASNLMSSSKSDWVNWQVIMALTLFLVLSDVTQGGAQSLSGNINIEKGGELWIEGSAGRINFKCEAEKLAGAGEIENTEQPEANVKGHGNVTIAVTLPVKSLNCGKRAMNKDMYEALKSDSFPNIQYQLLEAKLAEGSGEDTTSTWMDIHTRGIMEIAGVQHTTSFNLQGKVLENDRFQVKGQNEIHMDTYDITPPSAMLGLIKANKELSVHFNVTVRMENPEAINP